VIDTYSKRRIQDVEVRIGDTVMRTDYHGQFTYLDYELLHTKKGDEAEVCFVEIFSYNGCKIGNFSDVASARQWADRAPQALYLLTIHYNNGSVKTLRCGAHTMCSEADVLPVTMLQQQNLHKTDSTLSAQFSKIGYYDQLCSLMPDYTYELLAVNYPSVDYLNTIIRPEAFAVLQGPALIPKQSQIQSVKIMYRLQDDSLFYINSTKYAYHYAFATDILRFPRDQSGFENNYTDSPNRNYIIATINHYSASDIWGLEFFPGDMVSCKHIEQLYHAVARSSYFGDSLRLVVNAERFGNCSAVRSISQTEIMAGQTYQPLNLCEGYGYLRKVQADQLPITSLTSHDIVLLDAVPLDIVPVAGIITAVFQTPLSHINILSYNRGTPNMALRNAWQDSTLGSMEGKLVHLSVGLDTFSVRLVDLAEAEAYWKAHEPTETLQLISDTTTVGLVGLDTCSLKHIGVIGGKASNFAELYKTKHRFSGLSTMPLPEGAFAIPFSYYAQHLHRHGIDTIIARELADPLFLADASVRQIKLIGIQDLIRKSPIDTALIRLVREKISSNGHSFAYYRFRSSTNTEDIEDFNGAGLYDSYSGSLTDPDKKIDRAIKKVWASLWNFNAFEERDYFGIDHQTVQMAILVHRSFPSETANGVAVSKIIYTRPVMPYPGITINAQFGETSVTNPDGLYSPEELLCYTFSIDPTSEYIIEYLSKSDVPNMQGANVLTRDEIVLIAKITQDIQHHFSVALRHYVHVDVEFKIDMIDGKRLLYIKQARPY
jgi:pyruvate, water dikinase